MSPLILLAITAMPQQTAQLAERTANLKAPELAAGTWVNTPEGKPISLADRKGKVTIVHFWTFACENCEHNLKAYGRVYREFAPEGVEMIGIHTPELEFEKKEENVKEAITKKNIKFPVLIDGAGTNWKNWRQQVWPTVYVLDKAGYVRFQWQGELAWKGATGEAQLRAAVKKLLKEPS